MSNKLKTGLRCVVILVVLIGLWFTVSDAYRQIHTDAGKQELLGRLQWRWVGFAAFCYALGLFPAAYYWYRILRRFDVPVSAGRAIAAHIQGHLGKYVPGKAMVVVLRVGAIAGPGVAPMTATLAVFIETLTMMATGGTIAGIVVANTGAPRWVTWLAIGLVLAASLPTIPSLFRLVLGRLQKNRTAAVSLRAYDWSTFFLGWGWMSLTWIAIGASFAATVHAIVPLASEADLLVAAAAMGLAVVAGFVSLLPGGAGVRELILTAILAPRIGTAEALTAALLARVIFLAVEVVAAGVCTAALRRSTDGVQPAEE
ncbi:hypothetical protein FF011L_24410 [Roseimaritima multifibrata]|uniref:Flippase-like domain-containing protein n=1 Tax=Roseimaritima multifibrata TaxID=1930274 RepID=A0A517MFK3_9BACT|nr:lysylphosphatidylglycerol synthase domain-containing protein [Roseimaritima multifibrata]QDS93668.1 hypothetical protein FF011L_24410 [Roseimaritima multifibrata]